MLSRAFPHVGWICWLRRTGQARSPITRATLRVGDGNYKKPFVVTSEDDLERIVLEIACAMTPVHPGKSIGIVPDLADRHINCQRKAFRSDAASGQIPSGCVIEFPSRFRVEFKS